MYDSQDIEGLPDGAKHVVFTRHADARGDLTEIFRQDWPGLLPLSQWNASHNAANVFRGMHVHPRHTDYMVVLQGAMVLGLVDLRPHSPTHGLRSLIELTGEAPAGVLIPPGVLHGFFVPQGNLLVWGMSHGWSPDDEIECRWDDPDIGLDWPGIDRPKLSPRDAGAGSFRALEERYLAHLDQVGTADAL